MILGINWFACNKEFVSRVTPGYRVNGLPGKRFTGQTVFRVNGLPSKRFTGQTVYRANRFPGKRFCWNGLDKLPEMQLFI